MQVIGRMILDWKGKQKCRRHHLEVWQSRQEVVEENPWRIFYVVNALSD